MQHTKSDYQKAIDNLQALKRQIGTRAFRKYGYAAQLKEYKHLATLAS